MTDRESVIRRLQVYADICRDDEKDGGDMDGLLLHPKYVEAAIALLKAQEPKVVKRWKTSERMPYCPNDSCGRPLHGEWQKYCEYCGQAVKWE